MAASDAKPVPLKNTAFRVYFDVVKNDGTLITTWAGQDSEVSLDGGNFTDCTNEATEIQTSGIGYLDLTAAEMNADMVIVKATVTNTGALPVRLFLYPVENADIPVNATAISGDTTAADNLELQYDGTGLTGNTYPATQAELTATTSTVTDIFNAVDARLPATLSSGRMRSDMEALSSDVTAATNAEAFFDGTGYAGTNNVIPTVTTVTNGTGATAAQVWAYGTRTLTAVDTTVNIVNPFDANTARITIGYGEDRSTGSTNGALALTTTTDINLSTAGGTIYFAVREKQKRATESAVFTRTGTATAALAYTVSLTSATTRLLLPGTYLWTAWHVASGVYTDLGHGDYVVADLVTPTV